MDDKMRLEGNVEVTGNISCANISAHNSIETQGTITGGSINSEDEITATTNITAGGNIKTTKGGSIISNNDITANGNIKTNGKLQVNDGHIIENNGIYIGKNQIYTQTEYSTFSSDPAVYNFSLKNEAESYDIELTYIFTTTTVSAFNSSTDKTSITFSNLSISEITNPNIAVDTGGVLPATSGSVLIKETLTGIKVTDFNSYVTITLNLPNAARFSGYIYFAAIIKSLKSNLDSDRNNSIDIGNSISTGNYPSTINIGNNIDIGLYKTGSEDFNSDKYSTFKYGICVGNKITSVANREKPIIIGNEIDNSIINGDSNSTTKILIGNGLTSNSSIQVGIGTVASGAAVSIGSDTLYAKIATSSAGSWSVTSDKRDKTDFADIENSLEFITKLEPKTFVMNHRSRYTDEEGKFDEEAYKKGEKKNHRRQSGLIAQDVYETMKKVYGDDNYAAIVSYTKYDDPEAKEDQYSMTYDQLIPFLIGSIKELNEKNKNLEAEILKLKEEKK